MSARHVFFEHPLDEVLGAYAAGYETEEPILELKWIVDPFRKVVVFKVTTATDRLWMDVDVDSVVWHFVKSKWPPNLSGAVFPMMHVLPNGDKVIDVKWFIDPVRNVAVFRLLVETPE